MADSPTLFIHCILRFLPKEIPATYSILFCGSLRSRFPPLLHSPRPEGQTNVPLNRRRPFREADWREVCVSERSE
jgi:hypothetical protein